MVHMLSCHRVHKQSQGTFAVKEEVCKVSLIVNGVEGMNAVHDSSMDLKYMVYMLKYHRVRKQSQGTFGVREEDC